MTHSQPDEQVLIIDAGGGTVDISTYTILNSEPLQVEELYEPKCESQSDRSRSRTFRSIALVSRLASRRRIRHGEGEGDGPKCVLTFHPRTDYPVRNQAS